MLSAISSLSEYAQAITTVHVPFSRIDNALTRKHAVQWDMARLDLLDAELSGNKLFKLLPFLLQAKSRGITRLLSFGGAYSNHLHALAAAGKRFGFSTVGIVRAYPEQKETETIEDLRYFGMQIRFAGKVEYARRYDEDYLQDLQNDFPGALIIPEGGNAALGEEGSHLMAKIIGNKSKNEPCMIAVAMGTGTSFIGLLTAGVLSDQSCLCGYSALQNAGELHKKITDAVSFYAGDLPQWSVTDEYCFGGFAKMDSKLALFMRLFEDEQGFLLDPVYTAKLCYAIQQQIEQGIIPAGSKVLSLHTGGLQGRRGMLNKIEKVSYVDCQEHS